MKANKKLGILLGIFVTFLITLTLFIMFLFASENANGNTTEASEIVSELTQTDYVIITSEMTSDEAFSTIENRNGKVVVEIIEGVVLDDEGNGEYSYDDIKRLFRDCEIRKRKLEMQFFRKRDNRKRSYAV